MTVKRNEHLVQRDTVFSLPQDAADILSKLYYLVIQREKWSLINHRIWLPGEAVKLQDSRRERDYGLQNTRRTSIPSWFRDELHCQKGDHS